MSFFKNSCFRWFAGGFIFGAAVPVTASATDSFKDLEVAFGKFNLSGTSAWIAAALFCGVCSGILGLGGAMINNVNRKSAR